MGTIQVQSRVGDDGVLTLRIPLGAQDANTEVTVTIEPARTNGNAALDWHAFVKETYGSCAGLGLEEPPNLPL